MLHNLDKINWRVLNIISPECNLDCAYCNIAQCKKTSTCGEGENDFFKATVESIKNGSYLNNLKKVFDRFHQDPKDIIEFEIWG